MSRTNCLNHSCVLLVSSLYEYTNRTFREDDNPPLMCISVLVAKKVNAIVSTVSVARKVFILQILISREQLARLFSVSRPRVCKKILGRNFTLASVIISRKFVIAI